MIAADFDCRGGDSRAFMRAATEFFPERREVTSAPLAVMASMATPASALSKAAM